MLAFMRDMYARIDAVSQHFTAIDRDRNARIRQLEEYVEILNREVPLLQNRAREIEATQNFLIYEQDNAYSRLVTLHEITDSLNRQLRDMQRQLGRLHRDVRNVNNLLHSGSIAIHSGSGQRVYYRYNF